MINKSILLLITISFALTACATRYASMHDTMASCGYPSAKYEKFHDCMKKKVKGGNPKDPNDYYAKTTKDLFAEMQFYRDAVKTKKMSSSKAMAAIGKWVDDQVVREQQESQNMGMAVGALAIIAGGAACANAGCFDGMGGGGQSYADDHRGCCSWHGGIRRGSCTAGRLVCNDGQLSPSCPC